MKGDMTVLSSGGPRLDRLSFLGSAWIVKKLTWLTSCCQGRSEREPLCEPQRSALSAACSTAMRVALTTFLTQD